MILNISTKFEQNRGFLVYRLLLGFRVDKKTLKTIDPLLNTKPIEVFCELVIEGGDLVSFLRALLFS